MGGKRTRLAGVLDRLGVVGALLAARARARGLWPWPSLTVLTFHRVAAPDAPGFDPDVADTTPEAFERQVATIMRYFSLVDTQDLAAFKDGAPLPENPAMITFDDGYRDNHDHALPILRRMGARAVFFVATGYITDRRLFWWERISHAITHTPRSRLHLGYPQLMAFDLRDEIARERVRARLLSLVKNQQGLDVDRFVDELGRAAGVPMSRNEERALADRLLMTWDDVRALKAAGMDVQSHTRRHRILQTLSEDEATADLRAARDDLEEQLDAPVHAVAYPAGRPIAGDMGLRRAVSAAGYRLGFTCGTGVAALGARAAERLDWLESAAGHDGPSHV